MEMKAVEPHPSRVHIPRRQTLETQVVLARGPVRRS
jgi:hypothetical protein